MSEQLEQRDIVVVNQAVNYLTIGICNAFSERFRSVSLITGSIHEQGESLNKGIDVIQINKWAERPTRKKLTSYLLACWKIYWLLLFKFRKQEVFFVSLPPMAYLLSIFLPHRCSMLVWDVYPDVFKISGMSEKHLVYRTWASMNRIAFWKAYRLITIGERMADLIAEYAEREKILINPIWSIFQKNERVPNDQNPFIRKHKLENKFIVQYSGNIGLTHNVEAMVELAEIMKEHNQILFQIIGRGPRMPHLKQMVESKALPNCMFLPFQSDEMFPYSLSAADVGVVILDPATSKGSVPSKSYNLMSYGIPSLYIAAEDSELHDYSLRFEHAECFEQLELNKAAEYILKLSRNPVLYSRYEMNAVKASENFRRENADKLADLYINGTAGKKTIEI
ncbi:glycosyltransferase family 4 protein [soil metagenome]